MNRSIYLLPLIFICIVSAASVAPTLHRNINDPNLIVYFSPDEGYRMDVIWRYFSGQIRDSYQGDYEYGLLMLYLSDFARLILSRFMNFTPGTFVLILRYIHLIFWVGSLVVLWRFITYHFGNRWQSLFVVMILATMPAFPYFLNSLKPDPVVLFFMIIGLDYTLRIIEDPSKRNLFISIACSSLALIVKFSGIFLLPAIVMAMFLAERHKKGEGHVFPRIKIAWILYSFMGTIFIFLPLSSVLFYVRKSTGHTWYEQFGLWGSLLQNKMILYLVLAGIFFIFVPMVMWILNRCHKLKKIMGIIYEINSHALLVFGIFLGFTLLFGFRWIISPQYFLITYSELAPYVFGSATTAISAKGLLFAFFSNLFDKMKEFDPIIVILFVFYAIVEVVLIRQNIKYNPLRLSKRLILICFIIPFLIFISFSMTRVVQLHMLPFIAAMSILCFQGLSMFYNTLRANRWVKKASMGLACIFIIINVISNTKTVASSIISKHRQHEDIVFDLAKWWRENIPIDARVVADHHTRVYIPAEYKNIKTFKVYQTNGLAEFRRLIDTYNPQFIYYNEKLNVKRSMPPIKEIMPDKKVKLIKSFKNTAGRYQRRPGDRFVIYKLIYKNV